MALEYKDYYKILGVARAATDDEIRKAFRKLARQYHPDVARNKVQAEEKFKEINEAYEVLGDPEKRKKYDALGSDWARSGDFPPSQGGGPRGDWRPSGQAGTPEGFSFEFGGTGFSDFFEQFFGARGGPQGRPGGFPADFPPPDQTPSRGQDMEADIMVTFEEASRGSIRPVTLRRNIPCPTCGGTGQSRGQPCPACHGSGYTSKTETHKVKIPSGVRDGQRLRLAGHGEAGSGSAASGDLFLRVKFASHPDFRLENGELHHDLALTPWEAALGASVSVPTLAGPINIKIPPGTPPGQRLRLKGRGLTDRAGVPGDLFVITRLEIPKSLSDKEKAAWENLARESRFSPRE